MSSAPPTDPEDAHREVVAFTGMPGAGKSVAVAVAREMGLPVTRMGDAILAEVEARDLPKDETNVGKLASAMREDHGEGVWAERTLERIATLEGEPVVIDGVRTLAEVRMFRDALGDDFTLVAVHASPRTRRARLLDRGREDDVQDAAEFRARDERELGWGIGRVIALADVMLVNEDDLQGFRAEVRGLLEALGG